MTPLSTLSIGVWPRSLRLRVLQAATPEPGRAEQQDAGKRRGQRPERARG